MRPIRHLFFLSSFLVILVPLAAQPDDWSLYDERMARFSETNQTDSFIFYNEAMVQLARKGDDLRLWISARLDLADYYYEHDQEEAWSRQLAETCAGKWREPRTPQEWETLCYLQSDRGYSLVQTGKMLQAIPVLQDAAAMYERFRFEDLDPLESIYKPLGNCFTKLGDNDKALAVFFKSLLFNGDNETMAGLYCNLGIAYWNKGDYEAAEKYHRQGLALPGLSNAKRGLLLGALAQTLLDEGRTAQAARYATESLALLAKENAGDRSILEYRCYSRRTAGIAYTRLGKTGEANRLLSGAKTDALSAFGKHSRDLGKIELAFAELWLGQSNTAKAMEAANRALSAVLPGFQALKPEQNPPVTGFYEENVIFQALGLKAKIAEANFEKDGRLDWLTLALQCHDLAWQAEMRLRSIYQYSTSKLDLQGSSRAREASAMQVVRLLYEKTGQQQYLEKAFAIAERSKASLLRDAMHENLIRQRLAGSDPRFGEITTLRQNFAFFEKQMLLDPGNAQMGQWRNDADQLSARISLLESEINAAYPALAAQELADFSSVGSSLAADEALLEYFSGTLSIELFVFRKNQPPVWLSFPNDADLQGLVATYLAYFENQNAILNDPPGYLKTAFSLGQKLLPAELAGIPKLCIIPDGFISFIPFDALVSAAPASATTLRNAPYLLRRQEFRYAWSFNVLQQQKSLHSGAKHYALSVAPGFAAGQRGLAVLPSPAGERPSHSSTLLDEAADLQHFLQASGDYRVLHLSTHAFASVQDGLLPRLELYDQPLFLPSIYALPLRADLVTLSACQTGLGHEQSGEGVMSLARAFAQAGAACVVSSLWSVNDVSTSRLLAAFYRKLESGNTIGQALRDAKLDYLKDTEVRATMQSPYFWAGLTMVGDDRGVEGRGFGAWWGWVLGVVGVGVVWGLWRRRGGL